MKIEYSTRFVATFESEEEADNFFTMIPITARAVMKELAFNGWVVSGFVEPEDFEAFDFFVTDEGPPGLRPVSVGSTLEKGCSNPSTLMVATQRLKRKKGSIAASASMIDAADAEEAKSVEQLASETNLSVKVAKSTAVRLERRGFFAKKDDGYVLIG